MEATLAEDTAVLEAPETPAPEAVAPPETPENATAEGEQGAAAETPETETFTQADIDAAVERVREETRQQAEEMSARVAVTQHAQQVAQARRSLAGQWQQQLGQTIDWVKAELEKGNDLRWNQQAVIGKIAQDVVDAAFTDQFYRSQELFDAFVAREFAGVDAPADVERSLRVAIAKGDGQGALVAQYQKLAALIERKKLPELTTKAEQVLKDKQKEAQQAQQLKKQDAAAKGPSPTRGMTPAAGGAWTREKLDALPQSELSRMRRDGTLAQALTEAGMSSG